MALLITLLCLLEAAAVAALWLLPPAVGLSLAAALHLGACAALWSLPGSAKLVLLRLLLPVLGPFALLGLLPAMLCAPLLRRDIADAEAWRSIMFPNFQADRLQQRVNRLQGDGAGGQRAVAFADVLRWGEVQQQERVVAVMAREFRPEFAPLLRAALNAPARPLRAQAAAAVARVEAKLSAEALRLRAEGDRLGLARHLDLMAASGLIAVERAQELRREAVQLWCELPADAESSAALAGNLLALERPEEASQILQARLAQGVVDAAGIACLAEARFRLGDVEGTQALVEAHRAQLAPLALPESPLFATLRLWLAPDAVDMAAAGARTSGGVA